MAPPKLIRMYRTSSPSKEFQRIMRGRKNRSTVRASFIKMFEKDSELECFIELELNENISIEQN